MIPEFNKIHNKFKFNNSKYSHEELKVVAYSYVKEGVPFEKLIGDFLIDWLDDKNYIIAQTSGSTGIPKSVQLNKQAMVHSAIATGDFFNLKPGDKALHCLPSNFIAGKMMLVRAMILGLELDVVKPKTKLLFNKNKYYDFCAMLPMQLEKSLEDCDHIKTIIVGGAQVSEGLKNKVSKHSFSVYETYGMTETITHIAVKKLNKFTDAKLNQTPHFKTLPTIIISTDERGCLVIEAPNLTQEKIITNDIVKMHTASEFEWLGRYDNVINSGGLKLSPESIEQKLASQIQQRFFVASEPDSILGERLILIVEGKPSIDLKQLTELTKFEMPKIIYSIPKFIETSSGKLQRKKTLALVKQ